MKTPLPVERVAQRLAAEFNTTPATVLFKLVGLDAHFIRELKERGLLSEVRELIKKKKPGVKASKRSVDPKPTFSEVML